MNPPPSTTPSAPLGYSTPAAPAAAEGSLLDAWPLTLVLTVFATLVTATMLLVAPRAEDIFRDFKTELPTVTHVLLAVAHFGGGFAWPVVWVLPFLPTIILALIGPADDLPARRRALRVWRLLAFVATLAFVAAVVFAFFLPYVRLAEGISGGSGRRH